jgi:uncharacterized membrane protein YfcA
VYVVTSLDGKILRPYISGYLLLMGLYILTKAFRPIRIASEPPNYIAPLALTGGFVDAVGGGGWGPLVTTSLLSGGQDPRRTIGSVNAAEFFLAIAGGISFDLKRLHDLDDHRGPDLGWHTRRPLAAV